MPRTLPFSVDMYKARFRISVFAATVIISHKSSLFSEIWDALRAAAEADIAFAQAIVDSAGVIVSSADLTTCYDERGAKYELPRYVLSEPINLIRES
ncbi:hypothetical protein IFM89_004737 [Coptis chinensis]|uniref:DC-UbP/UBTD2 N-terminal domain-containing protein n=1 Tax=Coptis chinensis TaxID=261450 RepID=A0A835GWG1_9MAGN|nr:hypothetical protein IFM89_004737 [Coptis chinensis]